MAVLFLVVVGMIGNASGALAGWGTLFVAGGLLWAITECKA
jgi:hypothetical protein